MSRDWSSSHPFRVLRNLFGIQKPLAETWRGWKTWQRETQRNHPVGFWLTEKLPKRLEWFPKTFIDPIHNFRYYCRNRFIRKTHVLPTGFKPGVYHDFSERLLHGCMESLVDFVEVEKAWMNFDERHNMKWGRSAEVGLDHLSWEMGLDEDSPQQAQAAREIYAMYIWWKSRPGRLDPYEVSGYNEISDLFSRYRWRTLFDDDEDYGRPLPEFENWKKQASRELDQIETDYRNEDDAMLHRLINIRHSLWT